MGIGDPAITEGARATTAFPTGTHADDDAKVAKEDPTTACSISAALNSIQREVKAFAIAVGSTNGTRTLLQLLVRGPSTLQSRIRMNRQPAAGQVRMKMLSLSTRKTQRMRSHRSVQAWVQTMSCSLARVWRFTHSNL